MIFYTSTPDYYNDYIAHFGILGMKWGKKNGPPYPLGSDKSTGRRLKNTGSVKKKKPDRHERAANASARDAKNLREHGYTKEADAVQKVADQQRAKSKTAAGRKRMTDKEKEYIDKINKSEYYKAEKRGGTIVITPKKEIPIEDMRYDDESEYANRMSELRNPSGVKTINQGPKYATPSSRTAPNPNSRLTKEESDFVRKSSNSNRNIEDWNKSSTYSKDFLEYISWQVGSPETVDDPELIDLLAMEYESGTGKPARKDKNFILSDEAAKEYGVKKNRK